MLGASWQRRRKTRTGKIDTRTGTTLTRTKGEVFCDMIHFIVFMTSTHITVFSQMSQHKQAHKFSNQLLSTTHRLLSSLSSLTQQQLPWHSHSRSSNNAAAVRQQHVGIRQQWLTLRSSEGSITVVITPTR